MAASASSASSNAPKTTANSANPLFNVQTVSIIVAIVILIGVFIAIVIIGSSQASKDPNDPNAQKEELSDEQEEEEEKSNGSNNEKTNEKSETVGPEMDEWTTTTESFNESLNNEVDLKAEVKMLKNGEFSIELEVLKKNESTPEDEKKPPVPMSTRREFIKNMTLSTWNAYTTNPPEADLNSGRTIFASMSTLWVMNLKEEFNESIEWIDVVFNFTDIEGTDTLLNYVTEYMGSLLSSYALSGETELFLLKAKEVADRLKDAYNTSTGIPYEDFTPSTNERTKGNPTLSSFGGQFLEHVYLSDITNTTLYRSQVTKIRRFLKESTKTQGLYGRFMSVEGEWSSNKYFTLFEDTKEFYLNLIKSYLQSDGQNATADALQMYNDAIEAVDAAQMFKTTTNGTVWVRDYDLSLSEFGSYMQYSGCYIGALLALGASTQNSSTKAKRQMELAEKIIETCRKATIGTATGLCPSIFYPENNFTGTGEYNLGPELAESYFILWRLTHNPKYRDWAWEMAQAIDRHCRTESGIFSTFQDVNNATSGLTGHQPTIFLSGTLKYLYLTFTDDDILPLNEWIFNSVGHPLPICGKHKAYPGELCKNNQI